MMTLRTTPDGLAISLVDLLSATYGWNKNVSAHRVKRFLLNNDFDRTKIFKSRIKGRGVSRDGTWVCSDKGLGLEVCRQIKNGVGEPRGEYRTARKRQAALSAVPEAPDTIAPLTLPTAAEDVAFTLDSPLPPSIDIEQELSQYTIDHDWERFLLDH